ncbi:MULTISPECIES: 16S rRNA (cytidine(1402)-2'-O)-methyltransferase [unclassified Thioalkalivibrio]|uniref:16S rRNA (cytidine(1402)-2'-O)-methyltransferase n=1 Tax=unclassified Thioalkalivibrio TaxID=2621013 RepID=UPI0009D94448|nr:MULTISPECIES: 16S rRNA (cytidine(1402)-2'-O)-methyltransferase [unclassified Thioalkalivibrio]
MATPIGNLGDMSPRAGEVLGRVQRIAAEDTRHSAGLLAHLGVHTPLVSLHEHNEAERIPSLLEALRAGESVALISDAGTPLVSDPGFRLVRAAREAGLDVRAVPGPSAPLAALAVAGLPSDRFCFEGFLPHAAGARQRRLEALLVQPVTTILFESSHRVRAAAANLAQLAPGREVFLARELTKQFEEHYRGPAGELPAWLDADSNRTRGEFVLILGPAPAPDTGGEADTPLSDEHERLLAALLHELPLKRAARLLSDATDLPRNRVYARALALKDADG